MDHLIFDGGMRFMNFSFSNFLIFSHRIFFGMLAWYFVFVKALLDFLLMQENSLTFFFWGGGGFEYLPSKI